MTISKTSWLAATALGLGASALSITAHAGSSNAFETTLAAPLPAGQSVKINVTLSEDLAYRANHVSPNIRDRSRGSLNNGFAGRGKYGEKELKRLTDRLAKKMAKELNEDGIQVADNAPYTLNLVLADVDSTQPTFNQMSGASGVSLQSFGLGGASLEGTLMSADQQIGTFSYAWYESDIRDSRYGSTWSDAYRAIDRFADKTADAISGKD